jgi:RNA polymerase sigma-70 factor, ECF subfamily
LAARSVRSEPAGFLAPAAVMAVAPPAPACGAWRERAGWLGFRILVALASRGSGASERTASAARQPLSAALTVECERFIHEHERQILNYLWRVTGDEATAYDLTQEVFLRAWQRFETIRDYEQPRAWLFRVATNLALTHVKRRGARAADIGELDEERGPATSDPAWRLAESDLVRRTLLRLSPKRRAALVLREVYGLSTAEVGATLGMSETAVRMALHRAREQFRELYLREGGRDDGR